MVIIEHFIPYSCNMTNLAMEILLQFYARYIVMKIVYINFYDR